MENMQDNCQVADLRNMKGDCFSCRHNCETKRLMREHKV